jgi:hypothetical protein
MYPHELPLLRYQTNNISNRAPVDVNENLGSLASIVRAEPRRYAIPPNLAKSVTLSTPTIIRGQGVKISEQETGDFALIPSLTASLEWEALLSDDREVDAPIVGMLDLDGKATAEHAVALTFEDGSAIYFEEDDIVQVIISGNLTERNASNLKPGDQVLIIDGQRRQNLYSLILSRLHNHPAVALHLNLIRRWWEELEGQYLRTWRKQNNSYWQLLQAIKSEGSSITTVQTIQNWVKCIHSPDDPEDIRRISMVLSMSFSLKNYKEIHKAASRIHGLNEWLRLRLNSVRDADSALDGVVDDDLKLTLRDFEDSINILNISYVRISNRPILRSHLGMLLHGGIK